MILWLGEEIVTALRCHLFIYDNTIITFLKSQTALSIFIVVKVLADAKTSAEDFILVG